MFFVKKKINFPLSSGIKKIAHPEASLSVEDHSTSVGRLDISTTAPSSKDVGRLPSASHCPKVEWDLKGLNRCI